MCVSRCRGHCCVEFTLSNSIEEYKQWYDWYTAHGGEEYKEVASIYPMLLFVESREYADGEIYYVYNCTHHNQGTGDCDIYTTRPQMCKDYPYGNKCQRPECTWDTAKQLPEKPNDKI